MASLTAIPSRRSTPSFSLSEADAPPRKSRRPSEEADPADLVPNEYEEPSEELPLSPGKPEFDEPSESPDDAGEFSEPAP